MAFGEMGFFFCFMCKGTVGKVHEGNCGSLVGLCCAVLCCACVLQIRWFVSFQVSLVRWFVRPGWLVRSSVRPGSVCSFTRSFALLHAG